MERIVMRPEGHKYISVKLFLLFLCLAVFICAVLLFSKNFIVVAIVLAVISFISLVWNVADYLFYKISIDEEGVTLSENKILHKVIQSEVYFDYTGLCEIKHTLVSGEDGRAFSAIAVFYSDGVIKFLNTRRFSLTQINSIMSHIKYYACLKTGRDVVIFSEYK